MSHQAVVWAYEQDVQPSGSKFVLVTLAKDTGQSVRAVRAHVAKLEDAGVLVRERRHAKSGHRRSDGFWLVGFKALPADVAANQPAEPAARPPATVAASEPSLPANNVAPTGNYRHSLPADSAAPYIERTVSIDPSEEPRGYATEVVTESPNDLVMAFLEEKGHDGPRPPKAWMSEQHGHAEALIGMGCTEAQFRRLARYAMSQSWRTTIVTLKTLRGMYGDWVVDGMPEREPPKGGSKRAKNEPDFTGIDTFTDAWKQAEARR